MKRVVVSLGLVLALSCAGRHPIVELTAGGVDVVVDRADPEPRCTDLGPIRVSHGSVCSAFGMEGTEEGAYVVLRNTASARGANYVRLEMSLPPRETRNCLFTMVGTAFRCP